MTGYHPDELTPAPALDPALDPATDTTPEETA